MRRTVDSRVFARLAEIRCPSSLVCYAFYSSRVVSGALLQYARSRRISTGELNRWFEDAVEANPPPAPSGRRIKLRYITQVKSRPPTFVVFGTRVDQLPDSYRRYLLNSMRRDLKLGPVPMRLTFRAPKNPYQRDR